MNIFELIQMSSDTRICLSHMPNADEWGKLYGMAKMQSQVGEFSLASNFGYQYQRIEKVGTGKCITLKMTSIRGDLEWLISHQRQ